MSLCVCDDKLLSCTADVGPYAQVIGDHHQSNRSDDQRNGSHGKVARLIAAVATTGPMTPSNRAQCSGKACANNCQEVNQTRQANHAATEIAELLGNAPLGSSTPHMPEVTTVLGERQRDQRHIEHHAEHETNRQITGQEEAVMPIDNIARPTNQCPRYVAKNSPGSGCPSSASTIQLQNNEKASDTV